MASAETSRNSFSVAPLHHDKCEEGGDSIIVVYFDGKLDFNPVEGAAKVSRRRGAKGDH